MSGWWVSFRDSVIEGAKQGAMGSNVGAIFSLFFRNKSGKVVQKSVDLEMKEEFDRVKIELRYYRSLSDEYRRVLGEAVDQILRLNQIPNFQLYEPRKPQGVE